MSGSMMGGSIRGFDWEIWTDHSATLCETRWFRTKQQNFLQSAFCTDFSGLLTSKGRCFLEESLVPQWLKKLRQIDCGLPPH
ncbi:hypothetical protein Y032_0052g2184 [Ancylostoma ceylanicum]|uniref:Uncharacterized protein n=1 Tax=Ancylostoma ceylanicum TaxID=53326 RepID=A0A016U7D1_9BILA|nr:hypothetical protein Y032_0052g2184 [Ancylostoma ceylanicum]